MLFNQEKKLNHSQNKEKADKNWSLERKRENGEGGLTRVRSSDRGSSRKVTGALSLAFLLEKAVDCIVAMSPHSVGVVASPIRVDEGAISPSSTSIVQCLLKGTITKSILADAPCCT